jgi:hypothetical protein
MGTGLGRREESAGTMERPERRMGTREMREGEGEVVVVGYS